MDTVEGTESLQEMKVTIKKAVGRVVEVRKETEQNETKIYWLLVKMKNNPQEFPKEEVQMADSLEKKFSVLLENYSKMQQVGENILSDLEHIKGATVLSENRKLDAVCEEVEIASLFAKLYLFLKEGESCLEVDDHIQEEVSVLTNRLRDRRSSSSWYRNIKKMFKGIFL
jgi:hypothetical protein